MYTVYKITCLPNNKLYIGYTGNTIEQRWQQHLKVAFNKNSKDYNAIFKKAIRKYGKNNFSLEIIETVETLEMVKEREIYWINYYNSYAFQDNSNGYNSTYGGDGAAGCGISVSKFDIISGLLVEQYDSIFEAEAKNCRGVFECCHEQDKPLTANGACYFFTKDIENLTKDELINKVHKRYPTLLYQLSLSGEFLSLWRSASDAANSLNCSAANIIEVCLGTGRECCGYQWVYQRDIENKINKPIKPIKKTLVPVRQYSLNGEMIKEWNSIREASRKLNIQESKISSCCKEARRQTGMYQWRYANDNILKLPPLQINKRVICNETGQIFDTANAAAKYFKIAQQTVKKSCNGKKIKKEFSFSYIEQTKEAIN